jgi:hypothetical protein
MYFVIICRISIKFNVTILKEKGRGIELKTVRHIIDEKYNNLILDTKIEN